jgi:hypothetical protein
MRRVLRCDGLVSQAADADELRTMLEWFDANGGRPADVIASGESEPGDAAPLQPWHDAGATWWLESRWATSDPDEVRRRIEAGPVPSPG